MDSAGAGGPKVTEHQIMNQMQTELQVAAMQEFFQVRVRERARTQARAPHHEPCMRPRRWFLFAQRQGRESCNAHPSRAPYPRPGVGRHPPRAAALNPRHFISSHLCISIHTDRPGPVL